MRQLLAVLGATGLLLTRELVLLAGLLVLLGIVGRGVLVLVAAEGVHLHLCNFLHAGCPDAPIFLEPILKFLIIAVEVSLLHDVLVLQLLLHDEGELLGDLVVNLLQTRFLLLDIRWLSEIVFYVGGL